MSAADAMAAAAATFIESLSASQRSLACLPFDDHAERSTFYYFPNPQHGVPFAALDPGQQQLAHRLLMTGLQPHAYERAVSVIALENVLWQQENFAGPFPRDPSLYYTTIFGEPGAARWGWRFNGHHICVNYTIVDGEVASATPLFLGSNPARLQHEGYDHFRAYGDAEILARELLDSLSGDQRAKAVVSERAPLDVLLGNLHHPDAWHARKGIPGVTFMQTDAAGQELLDRMYYQRGKPLGIAGASLSAGQQELLARLVANYADRYPAGVAWQGMSDREQLHFAWAGGAAEGERHYYRLQGPELLIEYDNVQNGGNHVHTVCRHPANDFAARTLALHYWREHAP